MGKVKAWLFYWKNQPGTPAPSTLDGNIVAILSSRSSHTKVKELLERLYLEHTATPAELLQWRQNGAGPYKPQYAAFVHGKPYGVAYSCGHNPVLEARYAENVLALDEYTIQWEEVGFRHVSVEACRSLFGVLDCDQVGQAPQRTLKVSQGSAPQTSTE
ncbi:MAG: hypothetical protein NTV51_12960 [Verrucomicrobia bacterium]|nr:hypothetical protein [Verrucomicrobiota bacterium]